MNIGADLTVTLADGTTATEQCSTPTGSAGTATRANHTQISTDKLILTGLDDGTAEQLRAVADFDHHQVLAVLTAAFADLTPPAAHNHCPSAVRHYATRN